MPPCGHGLSATYTISLKIKKEENSSEKPSLVELAAVGLERRQQPTIDNSAEAPHAERVPLSAQKKRPK